MTSPAPLDGGEYIRGYYGVPARVCMRILFEDKPGVIVGFDDHYLLATLDGSREWSVLHPTWRVQYLGADGRVIWPAERARDGVR